MAAWHVERITGSEPLLVLPAGAPAEAAGLLPPGGAAGRRSTGDTVVVHGARRMAVRLEWTDEPGARILAAGPVIAALGLVPGLIPYQVRRRDGEFRIGPVVGILAGARTDGLDLSAGGYARQFLLRYPEVAGLVYLFGADGVDLEREEIDGWCWVPGAEAGQADTGDNVGPEWKRARVLAEQVRRRAKEDADPDVGNPRTARFAGMAAAFLAEAPFPSGGQGRWSGVAAQGSGQFVRGRFPFPGAIWRRADTLSQQTLRHLAARMGPRIFNSAFFDKQEGYRLLSADPAIAPHLPETEPFTDCAALLSRLERDGAAILKRQEGNSGYGLMRVDREGAGFTLRMRERVALVERFADAAALANRLTGELSGGRYLLQQWIRLPEYKGRPVDYRIMMQRDLSGGWVARGALGRFGARGAIVTNFVNNGYALPAADALRRAFGVDHRGAHTLFAGLIDFATAVCQALDRTGGCYGELGLDVALDTERRCWLFEVNKLPFLELPLLMGDEQMYLNVKSGGLLHAVHLAGFGSPESGALSEP